MDNTCGEPTGDGTPCQRTAGWGTDRSIGPCKDHATDHRQLRKLTPAVESAILGAKRAGAMDKHAAGVAGIDPNTLANWKSWAEEDLDAGIESDLTEFYLDYQRASGAGAVETLQDCSPEFVAERSFGYTKTQEIEHTGSGPIPVYTEAPDDETLRELLGGDGERE